MIDICSICMHSEAYFILGLLHKYSFLWLCIQISGCFIYFLDSTSIRLVFDQKAHTDFLSIYTKMHCFTTQKRDCPKNIFLKQSLFIQFLLIGQSETRNTEPETLNFSASQNTLQTSGTGSASIYRKAL